MDAMCMVRINIAECANNTTPSHPAQIALLVRFFVLVWSFGNARTHYHECCLFNGLSNTIRSPFSHGYTSILAGNERKTTLITHNAHTLRVLFFLTYKYDFTVFTLIQSRRVRSFRAWAFVVVVAYVFLRVCTVHSDCVDNFVGESRRTHTHTLITVGLEIVYHPWLW